MASEEVIQPGCDVVGRGDQKLGTVAYVIVNPTSMDVTDFVVSTGALLGRDVVVPTDAVQRVEAGKVYITLDKNGLEACDDYVDVDYNAPPADWIPAPEYGYPSGGMLWPAGIYYPEATSVTVNTPPGTVGLHKGMDVLSDDGHKIGTIDALETDPRAGHVTHIVVKQGHILTHDAAFPADAIQSVESDRVKLTLTRDQVQEQFNQQG